VRRAKWFRFLPRAEKAQGSLYLFGTTSLYAKLGISHEDGAKKNLSSSPYYRRDEVPKFDTYGARA
jgi:hypothetical protein